MGMSVNIAPEDRWSRDEIVFLRKHYRSYCTDWIRQQLLWRSNEAIVKMASRLKLKKKKDGSWRENYGEVDAFNKFRKNRK